jgi:hypothetical protein
MATTMPESDQEEAHQEALRKRKPQFHFRARPSFDEQVPQENLSSYPPSVWERRI